MSSADDVRVTRAKSRSIKILCSSCSDGISSLDELKILLSSLKNDFNTKFQDLNARFDAVSSQLQSVPVSAESFEEAVVEAAERVNRSHNVLFHSIPELDGNTEDRIAHDSRVVEGILSGIVVNGPRPVPVKVVRLGKRTANKARILRATFSHPAVARDVLKNKNKLAGTGYKNITLKDDKTPKQMEYLTNLRNELKRRTDAGEPNLTIKYVKGIPSIIVHNGKNYNPGTSTGHSSIQT